MLPSADKLYGDADLISSRTWNLPTLPKVPITGLLAMGLLCFIGQHTRLIFTIENVWGIVKRMVRDMRPNNADEPS